MEESRKVILSFDDGPTPISALRIILGVLNKNNIKAEFYVLGEEVAQNLDETKLITNQGHKIQNHSWSHPDLAKASEETVLVQLQKTQDIIKEATGVTPTKVRPPFGAGGWPRKFDPELAKVAGSLSLSIHNWDIDTRDWAKPAGLGPTKIEAVKKQLASDSRKNKKVLNILMHVQSSTARDLPSFIQFLKDSGFTFTAPVN